MASLFSILNQSASSLSAHQADAATASHNMANANTPGYARQRVELASVIIADRVSGGYIGRGVTVQGITQQRNRFIEAQLPQAMASAAQAQVGADALSSISVLNPDLDGGLGDAVSNFYSALRALAQNPSDLSLRQAAVQSAQSMALSFNSTSKALSGARSGMDAQLQGGVNEANSLATQLADLNKQVAAARAGGSEPNDLLDARLNIQNRLVELTGAAVVPDASGDSNLILPGGASLVSGVRAGTLAAISSPALGGHFEVRVAPAGGGTSAVVTRPGGELGGLVEARDGAIATAESRVDNLAFDLSSAINAIHGAAYALDGTTGRTLLEPGATVVGAASRLAVNADVVADPRLLAAASNPTTLPGDGTALNSLIATESQTLAGGLNPLSALSSLTTEFGAASARLKAFAEHDATLLDNLQSLRESASGVSVDEEMIAITKAQRGYEAVMKVIQTADQMLDSLMNLRP